MRTSNDYGYSFYRNQAKTNYTSMSDGYSINKPKNLKQLKAIMLTPFENTPQTTFTRNTNSSYVSDSYVLRPNRKH